MRTEQTLSLEQCQQLTWDCIVIGAGPAGAMAALQVARAGASVVCIDRSKFPRPKVCGGCVNADSVRQLEAVGIGGSAADLPKEPFDRLGIHHRGRSASVAVPQGWVVDRRFLDAALVDAAIGAGAHFLPGAVARINDVPADNAGRPTVGPNRSVCVRIDGQDHELRGRIVLLASGLSGSGSPRQPEWQVTVKSTARVGLHATIVDAGDFYLAGRVYMALHRHAYVGIVRLADGCLNLASAIDPSFLRDNGSEESIEQVLESAGLPCPGRLHLAHWNGTVPLTRWCNSPSGHRLFAIGDAAGYVEPFTGEGIAMALTSAQLVVPMVLRGISEWTPSMSSDWFRQHRALRRRQTTSHVLASLLRNSWTISALMSAVNLFPIWSNTLALHVSRPHRIKGQYA